MKKITALLLLLCVLLLSLPVSAETEGDGELEYGTLYISSFTVGTPDEYRIPVSFTVDCREDIYINFRISAAIEHGGGAILLYDGGVYTNCEWSNYIRIDELTSYGSYMLYLYVWYDDGETECFDSAYSAPFSWTNPEAAPEYDFTLRVLPEERAMEIGWPEELGWRAESLMLAVYQDGAAEPGWFDEVDPGEETSVMQGWDPGTAEVTVSFSVKYYGFYSDPVKKTFRPDDFRLSCDAGAAVNGLSVPVRYRDCANLACRMTVNETAAADLILNGSGVLNPQLSDGFNTLSAVYEENGITWELNREIYVDREAPVLNIGQHYDGTVTQAESIDIAGTVTGAETLTVNGAAAEIQPDGSFCSAVALQEGENTVVVEAADMLGNVAAYQAVITRGDGASRGAAGEKAPQEEAQEQTLLEKLLSSGWIVLAVVSLLCVLVVLYAVFFWKGKEKKDGEK